MVNLKQHRLRKHPKTDSSRRRHLCSECDKMFLTSSELKNHMVYHFNVRRFPCTSCESAFLEKRHLDRHLRRVHSGIKNFFCSFCGKAFFEKFELNYHQRMSSTCSLDEKWNQCHSRCFFPELICANYKMAQVTDLLLTSKSNPKL